MGDVVPLPVNAASRDVQDVTRPAAHAQGRGPFDERSDEELMALVRVGSQDAFRALVVRHAPKVGSFAARVSGDPASAREITQDVWLTIWDARERWHARGRFKAYLFTVAFTRARNHARSRKRRASVFSAEPLAPEIAKLESQDDVDRLLAQERQKRLWQAVSELPAAMREAVLLRFVDDLSYEEMERIVRSSSSTLRSRVHHALARLKNRLEEELP